MSRLAGVARVTVAAILASAATLGSVGSLRAAPDARGHARMSGASDSTAAESAAALTATRRLRHLRLVRSFPSADTVLTRAPDALRLWWSEAAELPLTKVELTSTASGKIPLEKITRAPAKGSPVVARIPKTLPVGTYRVSWRTMSRDGHAIKGEYAFRVSAQAARK
ncbi:MAG: copper resistance CopC family protein [Gemmatimonadota bacterium]